MLSDHVKKFQADIQDLTQAMHAAKETFLQSVRSEIDAEIGTLQAAVTGASIAPQAHSPMAPESVPVIGSTTPGADPAGH